jgi:hypothetical protein
MVYLAPSFRGPGPRSFGLIAFRPMTKHTSWWAHVTGVAKLLLMKTEMKGMGSHHLLKRHTPETYRPSHQVKPLKGSTVSQKCHAGDQALYIWTFG